MTDNPTRVLNALFALTDDPDSIRYEESDGHAFITLGGISLSLTFTSREALDKLAADLTGAPPADRLSPSPPSSTVSRSSPPPETARAPTTGSHSGSRGPRPESRTDPPTPSMNRRANRA